MKLDAVTDFIESAASLASHQEVMAVAADNKAFCKQLASLMIGGISGQSVDIEWTDEEKQELEQASHLTDDQINACLSSLLGHWMEARLGFEESLGS